MPYFHDKGKVYFNDEGIIFTITVGTKSGKEEKKHVQINSKLRPAFI